jgi:hypothetical protein
VELVLTAAALAAPDRRRRRSPIAKILSRLCRMANLRDVLELLFDAIDVKEEDLVDPNAVDRDAVPGDHIVVKISGSKMWHHAIYVGKVQGQRMVVEMTGKDNSKKPIQLLPLKKFGNYLVVQYTSERHNTADALDACVDRAMKLFKDANDNPTKYPYNVICSNCETLAILLRTNTWVLAASLILTRILLTVCYAPDMEVSKWP